MRSLLVIVICFTLLSPKLLAQEANTSFDFNYQPFISLANYYKKEEIVQQGPKSFIKQNRSLGAGFTFMFTKRFSLSFTISSLSVYSKLNFYNQYVPKDSLSFIQSFQSNFTSLGISPSYYFWFSQFYLAPQIHIQRNKLGLAGFTIDGQFQHEDLSYKNWFQRYGLGLQMGYLFRESVALAINADLYSPTIGLTKRYGDFVNQFNIGIGFSLKFFFERNFKE